MSGTTLNLIELVAAALIFVGSHFAISSTRVRPSIVRRVGESAYLLLYTALAVLLLFWLVRSYVRSPVIELWWPPVFFVLVPLVVMPLAILLVLGGLTQPNPTAVAPGPRYGSERPAPGVLAITRHPVLWGIGLWALSHLIVNGDLASLVFFGALAFLALHGTRVIDAKKQRRWAPEDWQRFTAVTSNVPFAALATSRTELHLRELGWWRLLLTGVLYIALIVLHGQIIGVPVLMG
jgi:uncharacterized membrane protein